MLLRLLENKKALVCVMFVLYLISYQVQDSLILPLERLLDFEITERASMVYLPAGFILLSFYLLRWWFLPLVLIGRTLITMQMYGADWMNALMPSVCVALSYPIWLYLLNRANWDVLGDEDESHLSLTGIMVFQFLVSITNGLFSAVFLRFTQNIEITQSLQYVIHFTVGDTLGAAVVAYLFYWLLRRELNGSR